MSYVYASVEWKGGSMDFVEELEAALGSLKADPDTKETWLRPLAVEMSFGYAVNILVKHALEGGYSRDEVSGVLSEAAVKVLKDASINH
ncbi:hypothetical protein [Rhizobium glycinendophyticum]|uniref:Uncharacterized protein n=1 Tax=Rhizobium glycinendophyticum TaxID=2589807 RepID=A0A504TRF0_9HYPH|nr:hypothetical protein [Rhizobium glycinendophyticum]TPP03930.1 hypothetical protein FJQ55_22835 [Rhizobium glycinendophyticum]